MVAGFDSRLPYSTFYSAFAPAKEEIHVPRQIDPHTYTWERLEDLGALLRVTAGSTVVDNVQFPRDTVRDVFAMNGWSYHGGCGYNYVEEAFVLSNGNIVASVSISSFTGTDHSGNTSVAFFLLTR